MTNILSNITFKRTEIHILAVEYWYQICKQSPQLKHIRLFCVDFCQLNNIIKESTAVFKHSF